MAESISGEGGRTIMAGNSALSAAVKAKKDEFYTQLTDIEKEMRYYRKHFKDKIVLCNCDDPFESNFFKYFVFYLIHCFRYGINQQNFGGLQ